MSKTIDYFLKYIKVDTQSSESTGTHPSTFKQHNLAKMIVSDLNEMGASDIYYDKEHCYVYATIPASKGYENAPKLGFIAHMDTSPAASGENVKANIVKNYDGKDILLNKEKNIVMSPKDFPELLNLVCKDLIVTDGTTLLGADDKAGVSEIMGMAYELLHNSDIKHGKIRIGFTPDEEIGEGPNFFDLTRFGCDFAYTVDGGPLGELEYENFNAASVSIKINGRSVHPGSAKNKMINAALIGIELQNLLPYEQAPMFTEKYEGFYHLGAISGSSEECTMSYIIRDHDREKFEKKKEYFSSCVNLLNQKYGDGTIECTIKDSYYNMKEIIQNNMHLIENAKAAMKELGIEPVVVPIRGGTDGARLSFKGLPCPNLFTGGDNYHGRFEYACIQSMDLSTSLLIKLSEKYATFKK